jgi:tetratricopeptide (TPR) repeat protein
MLLQPDSELYIIPAEGGTARKLRANTSRMNSWHSFSPNGKWLVFSSKAYSDYTQLCLTHIDRQGNSTPGILLKHFTAPDRAANIPEFVNVKPTAIKKICEEFLNDYSFVRAGNEFFRAGDTNNAIQEYKRALELNPNNADHDLGMALLHQRQFDQAITHLSEALRGMPNGLDKQYNSVGMHLNLALALSYAGRSEEAITHFSEVLRLDPNNAPVHYRLAIAMADQRDLDGSLKHYAAAVQLKPDIDTSPMLHYLLAMNYAEAQRFSEAVLSAEKALGRANAAGDVKLVQEINKLLEFCKNQGDSSKQSNEK